MIWVIFGSFFPPGLWLPQSHEGSAAVSELLELGAAAPLCPTAAGGRGMGLWQDQHGISGARRINGSCHFWGCVDVFLSLL